MVKSFGKKYIDYIFENISDDVKSNSLPEQQMDKIKYSIEKIIFQKCFKSLLYCLNVARVEGKLKGSTAEERYIYFCEEKDVIIENMNNSFPKMTMQIRKEIKGKLLYLIEVVEDYLANKEEICRQLMDEEQDIVDINLGGDWHNDKCVVIFECSKGGKVVFKPTKGGNIDFLKGISRFFFDDEYSSNYGAYMTDKGTWVKFVEHRTLENNDDIKEFYYNYGKLIFMTYILGINDMHYENVIANGKYPVITDVETIFSSYLFFGTHSFGYDAQYKGVKKLLYGTTATGLVPIFTMSEYFGGDVSCLSNTGFKINVEKLKNEYRDDMSIQVKEEMISSDTHLPCSKINPLEYGSDIIKGFDKANEIFKEEKGDIYKYVQSNYKKIESRIILNMTKAYAKILRIKNDVNYRMNPEKFEQLLMRLKRNNQFNQRVFEHEVKELCNGNIPSFYWNAEEKCVFGNESNQRERIMEVESFDETVIKEIIDYQTDEFEIQEQRNLIYNSILSSIVLRLNFKGEDLNLSIEDNDSAKQSVLRENIDKNIILGKDGTVAWIGLMVNDQEQLEYALIDSSLYSGLIGIGLMYYAEWNRFKDESALKAIQGIVNTLNKEYEMGKFSSFDISYFKGLTGIYSFVSKIGKIPEINLNGLKEKLELLIKENIKYTNCYDTLSGINSAVIYFYTNDDNSDFRKEVLDNIGKHFLENFKIEEMQKSFNYASFAHGYSGVMTALFCLNKVSPNNDFVRIIKDLYCFEKSLRLSDYNWIDKRREEIGSSHFWCHGSLGIMTSRLIWLKYGFLKEGILKESEEDIKNLLRKYKENILKGKYDTKNYSLCHGNFSFIDFLISYEAVLGERVEDDYWRSLSEKAKANGYSCIGAPGAINALGFMVGEAGIEYLLDRKEQTSLKSVLAMEAI